MGGGPLSDVLERAARRDDDAKNEAGFPCLECCGTFVVVLLAAFGVLPLDDDIMVFPSSVFPPLSTFPIDQCFVETPTFPPVAVR